MNDRDEKVSGAISPPVLAVVLILAGIAWLVVFYVSKGLYPVSSWRYWNLAIGFGAPAAATVILTRRR